MKSLPFLLGLFLVCSFVQCNNAQNKKTGKSAPVISNFQLSKKEVESRKVHYTNLGQFVSEVAGSRQGSSIYGDYLVQAHDGAGVALFD